MQPVRKIEGFEIQWIRYCLMGELDLPFLEEVKKNNWRPFDYVQLDDTYILCGRPLWEKGTAKDDIKAYRAREAAYGAELKAWQRKDFDFSLLSELIGIRKIKKMIRDGILGSLPYAFLSPIVEPVEIQEEREDTKYSLGIKFKVEVPKNPIHARKRPDEKAHASTPDVEPTSVFASHADNSI